ncbi:transfer complex protein TrsK-like protein (plasmid) [Fischerella sp. NIES-4106]|nr:transfer complex protein TrsK-like protein [Fischerella sp. NIES-4106]
MTLRSWGLANEEALCGGCGGCGECGKSGEQGEKENMRDSSDYIATNTVQSSGLSRTSEQLGALLKSKSGLMLVGCLVVIGIFSWLSSRHRKGKVATSYWGGASQKATARKKATEQMNRTTRNNVALYVGMPGSMREQLEASWRQDGLLKNPSRWSKQMPNLNASQSLYIPDAQRGIAAIGAAGSGKTFSVIDPLIRSAFDQGFPVCLYDFKYRATRWLEITL